MGNLSRAWLEHNSLTGALPASFGGLGPRLRLLALNNNGFTGDVPAAWGQLTGLTGLFLYNNAGLGGCLPVALQQPLQRGRVGVDGGGDNDGYAAAPASADASFDVDLFVNHGTLVQAFCSA
jgi:hypothetical protein